MSVTFEVLSGGGGVQGGTVTTGSDGIATVGNWTLGTAPGVNSLRARALDAEVLFTATATVGAPALMEKLSEDGATVMRGKIVPSNPEVRITDAHGNRLAGVTVEFVITVGTGVVQFGTRATDADGRVSSGEWRLMSAGTHRMEARVAGVQPVVFNSTALGMEVVTEIHALGSHSCATAAEQSMFCWGFNESGQLGTGSTNPFASSPSTPQPVQLAFGVSKIVGGRWHSCALTPQGAVYCWGDNRWGQLGAPAAAISPSPVRVLQQYTFDRISAREFDTCAQTTARVLYCWGSEGAPRVVASAHEFESVSRGALHTCGIKANGAGYCWVNSDTSSGSTWGQLGNGTNSRYTEPTAIAGSVAFSMIDAGLNHTCGVSVGGRVYCWGRNFSGQLGVYPTSFEPSPVEAELPAGETFVTVAVGNIHSCALSAAGRVYCWGGAFSGQTGHGEEWPAMPPAEILGGRLYTSVSTTGFHSCARSTAGEPYCWGSNEAGELGIGSRGGFRSTPARVNP